MEQGRDAESQGCLMRPARWADEVQQVSVCGPRCLDGEWLGRAVPPLQQVLLRQEESGPGLSWLAILSCLFTVLWDQLRPI
jgi:hypothetical protein